MKYERVLPENFNGVFYFTNWSDEDFAGKWGGKEYWYPAGKTSPMIIPEHSPIEIQNIRKKFAKDLAEREFFRTKSYEGLRSQEGTPNNRTMSGIHQAATYSIETLTPFIQRALEPLPIESAKVTRQSRVELVEKLSTNEDGELNSSVVNKDKDLESLAKGQITKSSLEAKVFA